MVYKDAGNEVLKHSTLEGKPNYSITPFLLEKLFDSFLSCMSVIQAISVSFS